MESEDTEDIDALFAEALKIDEAVCEARRQVLQRHRQIGQPLVVRRDGEVQLFDPDSEGTGSEAA